MWKGAGRAARARLAHSTKSQPVSSILPLKQLQRPLGVPQGPDGEGAAATDHTLCTGTGTGSESNDELPTGQALLPREKKDAA